MNRTASFAYMQARVQARHAVKVRSARGQPAFQQKEVNRSMQLTARLRRAMSGAGKQKRVGLISLGCPKNLVDSEVMLGELQRQGYSVVDDLERV